MLSAKTPTNVIKLKKENNRERSFLMNAEEKDIIERLYFNDETVRSVAKLKSITHPALIKRRNKILEKLKKFIEEL